MQSYSAENVVGGCPRADIDSGLEMDLASKTRFTGASEIGLPSPRCQLHRWESHRALYKVCMYVKNMYILSRSGAG